MERSIVGGFGLLVFAAFIVTLAGCVQAEQKLAKGRCRTNAECPTGTRCEATFCEDIYHPRSEVKNY